MKKYNLINALNGIDDQIITTVSNIDTKEKLKDMKEKEKLKMKNTIFKILGAAMACCLVLVTYIALKPETTTIANPLTEVKSVIEMKEQLGYNVPVLEKEVKTYIVIVDNSEKHGRIIYKDGSRFDLEKQANKDVSGIYGGTLVKEETVSNIKIKYFTSETANYMIWSNNGYSYSYDSPSAIDDTTVQELINLTK